MNGTENRVAGTSKGRHWLGVGALAAVMSLASTSAFAQTATTPPVAPAKPAAAAPAAGAAAPKPNLAEARKQYQTGEAKFKAGDYAAALSAFQASDAIKATPQNARYIALSEDKLGQYPDAAAAYERFLAEVPPNLKKEGDEATKRLAEIKAMPGKVHIESTPAAAKLTIDGQPASAPPTDVDLVPGKHTLHVAADGFVAQDRDVDVVYASKQDIRVDLEAVTPPAVAAPPPVAAAPPPAASDAPPAAPRSKVPAFVTGGIAVAAAGVATVFGIMALNDKNDFDSHPTSSKADDGENHALICDMALGVAITLGVTSTVLFLSASEEPKPADKAASKNVTRPKSNPITIRPTPIVTPHGGGAGAVIRF